MIIDCYATDKYAVNKIAEVIGDKVVSADDIINEKSKKVFSEKPYVMIIDYKNIFSVSLIAQFYNMQFTGSKILYCIFIADKYKRQYGELAQVIASNKKFIVFGCDVLNYSAISGKEEYVAYLTDRANKIKNITPFENYGALKFPLRSIKNVD